MSRSHRGCQDLAVCVDGSEPPPPPSLSSTTFRSTPQSPDLVLHEGDLMESLGGSSLQQIPSLLSARFDLSGGRRDLLRWWMLDGHRSPYHTRIEWQIRFDLSCGLLGWDQGSKPSAGLDIGCCGCSCNLLDFGQALCRVLLL
uniref:Uncharacterized protein n=1 Tax=Fagus sylvatica TaxID=28930 RepID=A0A2N9F0C2_FAGSY